ncbi:xanthine dehydrogenase accessory factor [Jatrophihabitans sp. GAS493]|uniref:XdhC family protein n=1 Tax=Jatrophihabitans sp. GAS493 TaxID=1907575 RepID=UPI000BB7AC22|nr:XdhC/CoxI family protein [Jatrophihabitans sp. GAS493]SOD73739.1 xanthine dehydrogenase accessory factor [Jatrophihabitans sp. GAS493]
MLGVIGEVAEWAAGGKVAAVATVVRTWSSAPRQPGSALAVLSSGDVIGSVSGGCVEGAVYDLGQQVLTSGEPALVRYGVADDDAMAVGLTCGGTIELFVEAVSSARFPALGQLAESVRTGEAVALATLVGGRDDVGARMVIWRDRCVGGLGSARLDAAVTDDVRGMLENGVTATLHLGADGERLDEELTIFVESFLPPPRLYIFGATDFAAALAGMGKYLGYRVTVCDARPVFATAARFRDADEVVVEWPHRFLASAEVDRRTAICVLTHDPKFDVPLLEVALRGPAGYVGAMGSRRTSSDRLALLRARGLSDAELERLRGPVGLDLGARTPQETAVSIAAEIVASRWGGSGRPLADLASRIHRNPAGSGPREDSNG